MEWGVKANLAEPRSAMRTGSLVWVVLTNPGWGGERLFVLARSRGGRLIQTWIGTKRLTNLRAAWVPEHLRDRVSLWETKESAAEWAAKKQAMWANDKGVGLDAAGGQSRTTGGLCHTGSK